ncbi:hypothetical protein AB0301_16615 [Microbacterium profundi]|uniref:Uncharacterized protein n=1 Tax=Microbacterium profundi TaxID=450380 RepID=A0ABV3LLB2_9MICO
MRNTATTTPAPTLSESPVPAITEAAIAPELQGEVDALVAGVSMLYYTASETNFDTPFDKVLTTGTSALVKMQIEGVGDTMVEVMYDGPLSGDDWSFGVDGTTELSTWRVSRSSFSPDPEDYVTVTFARDAAPTATGNGKYAGVTFSGQ